MSISTFTFSGLLAWSAMGRRQGSSEPPEPVFEKTLRNRCGQDNNLPRFKPIKETETMLQPYHGTIRNIACLFAHGGHAEEEGNRIYEIAAAVIAPDRPEETFASPCLLYTSPSPRD